MSYGIYTGGDRRFFPGIVAAINALRWHGCRAPVAVLDNGLDPWMAAYLDGFPDVKVFDLAPLTAVVRYVDFASEQSPLHAELAFKAVGITELNLFDRFTFIDADLLPLCNLEAEMAPLIATGAFVGGEDGWNEWTEVHAALTGVAPGRYPNLNSGLFAATMDPYGWLLCEWTELMRHRRIMETLFLDQGALNLVLDRHGAPKLMLDRTIWNQAGLNEALAKPGQVRRSGGELWHEPSGRRILAWHTAGVPKLWEHLGVDFTGRDPAEVEQMRHETTGSSPTEVVRLFNDFLFLDQFHAPVTAWLRQHGLCAG